MGRKVSKLESAAKAIIHQRQSKRTNKSSKSKTNSKKRFPPEKQSIDLRAFLENNRHPRRRHHESDCFEDANFIYVLDYSESGARLTFAINKEAYMSGSDIFDLTYQEFDARFILGQNIAGYLRFGHYRDNNLGRVFYLSEPEDATHMILSLPELSGRLEWLKNSSETCYFYHNSTNHQLFAILRIGARLDEENELVAVHYGKLHEDRSFYQKLFNERLRIFLGEHNVTETMFKVEIPPPTEEELAEKTKMELAESERKAKLQQNIENTQIHLEDYLDETLDHFGLCFKLSIGSELRLIGSQEVVKLSLMEKNHPSGTVYELSCDSETFLNSYPVTNASFFANDVKRFLENYSEKFSIYKKFYAANKSYHELVNLNSYRPRLDYPHIFETEKLLQRRERATRQNP